MPDKFDDDDDTTKKSPLDAFAVGGVPNWVIPLCLLTALAALFLVFVVGGDDEPTRDEIITQLVDDEGFNQSEASCLYDEVGSDAELYLDATAPDDADLATKLLQAATACGVGG